MRLAGPALIAALALSLAGSAGAAGSKCRDAKGKFIKCPAAAAAKPVRCKDGRGKFAKCDAPGAKPV